MAILKAKDLASYIIDRYETKYFTRDISGIKLQKSLYFLFALWGGFIRKSKTNQSEEKMTYDEFLFDDEIQAWVYGPVIPEIFKITKTLIAGSKKPIDPFNNEYIKGAMDAILDDVFAISDFKLVEISHNDKCWMEQFNYSDKKHCKKITLESIVNEYATK